MAGIGHRRGVLTAGGAAVHRVSGGRTSEPEPEARPKPDEVPVVERYMELSARHMHRVATVACGDRFLSGCSCGWAVLSVPGIAEDDARTNGARHAIDEAYKLREKLEARIEDSD